MRPTVKIVILDMTGTFIIKDATRQDWDWFFHRGILVQVWQGRTALCTGSLPALARPLACQLNDAVCLSSLLNRLIILPEEVLWVSNDAGRAREAGDNERFQVLDVSGTNTLDRDEIAKEVMRIQGDGH